MIDKPTIVTTITQPTAVIHFTIPRAQIREVMGPAMTEVLATVAAQKIGPAGPLFSHHFRMDPEVFDFEVGAPVSAAVAAMGRVQPSELPAMRVAQTVYRGPYEGLADAWAAFDAWIAAEGLSPAPNLWERYVSGPESSPNPADWHTELTRPLLA